MELTLDDTVIISEGEIQQLCVAVSEPSPERERDIHISLLLSPTRSTENGALTACLIMAKINSDALIQY